MRYIPQPENSLSSISSFFTYWGRLDPIQILPDISVQICHELCAHELRVSVPAVFVVEAVYAVFDIILPVLFFRQVIDMLHVPDVILKPVIALFKLRFKLPFIEIIQGLIDR